MSTATALVPLTAEIRVRSQVIPCEIRAAQSVTVPGFFFPPSTPVSPVNIIPPMPDIRLHLREGQTGEAQEPCQKVTIPFPNFGPVDSEVLPVFSAFSRPRLMSVQHTADRRCTRTAVLTQ